MLVDTHVHVALNTLEPVEMVLMQMQYNQVEKALLMQHRASTDNCYLIESMRRFPGRFSVDCRVDVESAHALDDLEHWHHAGAEDLRLKDTDRSPGNDPLAIWRKAQELGMSVNVGAGPASNYASREFLRIVEELPQLKFIFEHLAGMGLKATASRPKSSAAEYSEALKLARYPNTYIKIHGMSEICSTPFPFTGIPPYIKMAFDAFGPRRMMWGSDWPLVVRDESYRNALRFTMEQMTFCSRDDLDWIFGNTALTIWSFL